MIHGIVPIFKIIQLITIAIILSLAAYNDYDFYKQPSAYKTLSKRNKNTISYISNHLVKIKACKL